jgi:hypothetical protein
MNVKKYICHFVQGTRTQELVFDIEPGPVSEIWSKVIIHYIESGFESPAGFQHCSSQLTPDDILKHHDLIQQSISTIQSRLPNYSLPWVRKVEHITQDLDITQNVLNKLHQQFQVFEESKTELDQLLFPFGREVRRQVYAAFNQLNHSVHALEALVDNGTGSNQVVWFQEADLNNHYNIEIVPEIRNCWASSVITRPPGALYVGYSTIGKNILHAFMDNDSRVVEQGLLRPQLFIDSEVILHTRLCSFGSQEAITEQIKNWVADNQLGPYVELSLPEHRYFTQPYLGKARINNTVELEELFTNWYFYKISIE